MRRAFLFVILAAGSLLAQAPSLDDNQTPPLPGATAAGRFQLVAGTICTDGNARPVPVMMRIDTATGKVWVYQQLSLPVNGTDKTILTEGWRPTTESLSRALADNRKAAGQIAAGLVK